MYVGMGALPQIWFPRKVSVILQTELVPSGLILNLKIKHVKIEMRKIENYVP